MNGSIGKRQQPVFQAIMKTINERFNAHNHKVDTIMADPEAINISLQAALGALGILIKYAYPDEHAVRLERATRTVVEHSRSTAAGLHYILPPECQLLLSQSVCESLNNSVNKDTYPLTPNEAVSGFRPVQEIVEFGRVCMVLQPIDKSRAISTSTGIPFKQVPKTEIGVSMGPIPGTDHTRFLLANGKVVPRRQVGKLFPRTFIPFGWTSKPCTSNPSSLPLLPVDEAQQQQSQSIHTEDEPQTPQRNENINVQQPDSNDATAAIETLPSAPAATQQLLPSNLTTTTPTPTNPLTTTATTAPPAATTTTTPSPPTTPFPTPTQHHTPVCTSLPHQINPPITEQAAATQQPHTPASLAQPQPATTISNTTRHSSRIPPHVPGQFLHLNSRGPPSAYAGASSGHLQRKLENARNAAQRERQHKLLNPPPPSLNNHLTNIMPIPPTRQQNEFSLKNALLALPPVKVSAALQKEINKVFIKFGAMKLINKANIEKHAVFLRSLLIIREKTNKDVTARLAINGAGQPSSTYSDTHAGTSDPAHRIFILATALADAAVRNKDLITASFDIEGAFINGNKMPRSATGGHQLLVRLPKELPPPYGGALSEIMGSMYGLKQSNHIYDQDLIKTICDAGYTSCPSHPYTFIKRCPLDPADYLIVSFHVDDGELVCTSNHLLPEFINVITKRYGITKFHTPSQGICGIRLTTNPDKSITLDFGQYIDKMMLRIGMDKVPPALSPSRAGLFVPSDTLTGKMLLPPALAASFVKTNGELLFLLPLRHDARKEIIHLCRSPPNHDNFAKQFHLLRYLKNTAHIGPTFSANKADFPNGVEISSASDAAHNVHPATGRSHSAYTLTVGPPNANTSPFLSYSKAEASCIPLSPAESEYATMSRSAKPLMHFRDFHTDLGFSPKSPSKMLADNLSAIKLVQAPQVPPKSRHIRLPFHHIRDLYKTGQIEFVHQGGMDLAPDVLTKDTGPSRFLYFRDKLFGKVRSRQSPIIPAD